MDFDISGMANYKLQLCHFRVFHNKLPRMSQTHEYMALDQISNHPRISLVGEIDKTLMYFNVL